MRYGSGTAPCTKWNPQTGLSCPAAYDMGPQLHAVLQLTHVCDAVAVQHQLPKASQRSQSAGADQAVGSCVDGSQAGQAPQVLQAGERVALHIEVLQARKR